MSNNLDNVSNCSSASIPDFRSIFNRTLLLLDSNKRNNKPWFDVPRTEVENCFWNLNVPDMNAKICANKTTDLGNFCSGLVTTISAEKHHSFVVITTTVSSLFTPSLPISTTSTNSWVPEAPNNNISTVPDYQGIGRSVQQPDNPNLLGLLALLIIPIALIAACLFCFIRNKRNEKKSNIEYNHFHQSPSVPSTPKIYNSSQELGFDNPIIVDDSTTTTTTTVVAAVSEFSNNRSSNPSPTHDDIERQQVQTTWSNKIDDMISPLFGMLTSSEMNALTPPLTPRKIDKGSTSSDVSADGLKASAVPEMVWGKPQTPSRQVSTVDAMLRLRGSSVEEYAGVQGVGNGGNDTII